MLRKNHAGFLLTFFIASVLSITAQWQEWYSLVYVFKPLMMLSLSVWFFLNTRMYGDRFTLIIQAGLFFSLLGDIAFMLTERDEFFFLIGLATFLIAMLCYLIGFVLNIGAAQAPWQGMIMPATLSICLFGYWYWFSGVLMPRVDRDISMAVWAYFFVITFMGAAALLRWQRTFKRSWWLVSLGALLFIGFNSLLMIDRFVDPLPDSELIVWSVYATAQALTAIGCVWHVRSPTHVRKQEILKA